MSGATSSGPMTIEAWIKQRLKREAWAQLLQALVYLCAGIVSLIFTMLGVAYLIYDDPGTRYSTSPWVAVAVGGGYFLLYLIVSWEPQVDRFKRRRGGGNWWSAYFGDETWNGFRQNLRETPRYVLFSAIFFGPMLIGNSFLSLVTMYRFWEPDCREEARIMLLLRESERAVRISELERLVRGNDLHRSLRNLSYIRGVVEIEVEGEAAFTLSGPTRAELNQLS